MDPILASILIWLAGSWPLVVLLPVAVGSYGFYKHAIKHTDGSDDIQTADAAQKGLMSSAHVSKVSEIDGIKTEVTNARGSKASVDARLDVILNEDGTPKIVTGPGHIFVHPATYDSIGQGTWILEGDAGYLLNHRLRNTTADNGDNISYKIYLVPGTYTLVVYFTTAGACAIADVDIDAAEVASWDLYSAAETKLVRKIQTGISIDSAGLKTLKFRADGKNASSTDYNVPIEGIMLWRTA